MTRYALILLCFLCARTSFSQTSGYQGKRFFVEVGTSFWFSSFNPRANNIGPRRFPNRPRQKDEFSLQEHYFLSLNYVLSRKIVFSLEYEYSKTGLQIDEHVQILVPTSDVGAITASKVVYGFIDRHNLFYNVYAHKTNFSFQYNFKPKTGLVPLGWYIKLGLDFVLAKGVLLDQKVNYGHDSNFNNNKASEEFTNPLGINTDPLIPMVGLSWGFGYRRVIANRFILHGALQSTIFPQIFYSNRRALSLALEEERYEDRNNLNYRNRVHQRVQAHYYLNIVIGVGILIF